ncbi:hypothetical protein Arth_4397 (plasmid) [Arthrobacter sp. FB24]|nr:hypothetical protein Arth_4397 [Arthrobacter sp. FB24]
MTIDEAKSKRSNNVRKRVVAATMLSAFVISFGAGSAVAGDAWGDTGYYTVSGIQYENFARVSTSTGQATAESWARRVGGNTPVGYAGARGRLFTSGGSLSCEGVDRYNPSTGSYAVGSSCARYSSGTWYSYGVTQGWNGTGYTAVYTFRTVNQNS